MLLIQSDSKFVFICIYLLVYKNHMLINCFVTQIVQCLVYLLTQMMASFTVIVPIWVIQLCITQFFFNSGFFFSNFWTFLKFQKVMWGCSWHWSEPLGTIWWYCQLLHDCRTTRTVDLTPAHVTVVKGPSQHQEKQFLPVERPILHSIL